MINKIVFAAGGTGGHIYPAIAIADELKKLNEKIDIYFIGARGKIEEKIIPSYGYRLKLIDIRGFYRNTNLKNLVVLIKLAKSIRETKMFLREYKPEIVFGTSGYVSGPVLWAAHKLSILTGLIGGDFYPAVTTRMLSSKVDRLFLNFEESKKFFKRQDNIEIVHYPIRQNLKKYPREEALKYFGLDGSKKTLFVFGGSQGASSINKAMLKCIANITNENIQIIWQTGKNDYEVVKERVRDNKFVKVYEYIERIDYGYSASDLIVCRAGISTIMETAYYGGSVVFVPYPFAANNHQEKNALALVNAEAAEMILDKELDAKLCNTILRLMKNEHTSKTMGINISKFADQDAASKIARELINILNISKN
jgi:UDP-N-acetylglucosamine--N-acetylmuramyl-(pentapeptide) pyrophosphoryl-undecaprenol N-acetylglucosamine transferase